MNPFLVLSSTVFGMISVFARYSHATWISPLTNVVYGISVWNHALSSRAIIVRAVDYAISMTYGIYFCWASIQYMHNMQMICGDAIAYFAMYWACVGYIVAVFLTRSHVNSTICHMTMHVAAGIGAIAFVCFIDHIPASSIHLHLAQYPALKYKDFCTHEIKED